MSYKHPTVSCGGRGYTAGVHKSRPETWPWAVPIGLLDVTITVFVARKMLNIKLNTGVVQMLKY